MGETGVARMSQRVRPEVAGPMTGSTKSGERRRKAHSVMAGLDPAIHAEPHLSVDHRVKFTAEPATSGRTGCPVVTSEVARMSVANTVTSP
jgi:hypothetical protein